MAAPVEDRLLAFVVGGSEHALPLSGVEKAEFAASLCPLPEAPRAVIGALDWGGQVLPAVSMRRCLNLPDKPLEASDRFLIVKYSRRRMALVVDEIVGVLPVPSEGLASAESIADGLGSVAGALPVEGGIILVHDLELLLSDEDEDRLDSL